MKDDRDNDGPPPPPPGLYAVPSTGEPDQPSAEVEPPQAASEPPLDFLIEPRIMLTGGIHLLGGAPLAGKSTVMAQLLRQFIAPDPLFLPGMSFASMRPEELGVIITDRRWIGSSELYRKAGLGGISHYALADDPEAAAFLPRPRPAPAGVALMRFCLARLPETIKLLAVDVLTNQFCGNIFQGASAFLHMNALQQLAKERGLTILGICYGNKLKQGKTERYQRAVDRIRGCAEFRGAAESVMYLDAPEEGEHTEYQRLVWYTRYEQQNVLALQRHPNTHPNTGGLFFLRRDVQLTSAPVQETQEGTVLPPSPKRRGPKPDPRITETILAQMPPGMALSRAEVARKAGEAGIPKTTLYTTFQRLIDAGELVWDEERGTLTQPLKPEAADPEPQNQT